MVALGAFLGEYGEIDVESSLAREHSGDDYVWTVVGCSAVFSDYSFCVVSSLFHRHCNTPPGVPRFLRRAYWRRRNLLHWFSTPGSYQSAWPRPERNKPPCLEIVLKTLCIHLPLPMDL